VKYAKDVEVADFIDAFFGLITSAIGYGLS